MDLITAVNSRDTKEKAEKVDENNRGDFMCTESMLDAWLAQKIHRDMHNPMNDPKSKVLTPFAGRDLPQFNGPVVPTMQFMIQITPEFEESYKEYVKKMGLDGGEIVKLLMTLGVVALKKIFDEQEKEAGPAQV